MVPEALWRIRKMNGWSARNTGVGGGIDVIVMTIPVAAAASVPFSFTSTKAWCATSEILIRAAPAESLIPVNPPGRNAAGTDPSAAGHRQKPGPRRARGRGARA